MTEPAAGWYPDPGGSGGSRYWNGTAWTDHVAPAVQPMAPPQGEPVLPPTTGAAAPDTTEHRVTADDPAPPLVPASGLYQEGPYPGAATYGVAPAPPLAPVATAVGAKVGPDGQPLAGWWRRFFGYMIDSLLVSVATFLVLWVILSLTGGLDRLVDNNAWETYLDRLESNPGYQPSPQEILDILQPIAPLLLWAIALTLVLSFLNGVILVARSGQTIADRLVNTRKVVVGRRPPTLGPAFVRWLIPGVLSLLSWVLPLVGQIPWILDYLWPLWDPRKQTWHDKAAGTFVERADQAGPVRP